MKSIISIFLIFLITLTLCAKETGKKETGKKNHKKKTTYEKLKPEFKSRFSEIGKITNPWIGVDDMLIIKDRNKTSTLIIQLEKAEFDKDGEDRIGRATLYWVLITAENAESGFIHTEKKFLKEKVKVVRKDKEGTHISYRHSEDIKDFKIGNFKINWSMRADDKVYIKLLHRCSYAVVRPETEEKGEETGKINPFQ